jgi:hypothetical protein
MKQDNYSVETKDKAEAATSDLRSGGFSLLSTY